MRNVEVQRIEKMRHLQNEIYILTKGFKTRLTDIQPILSLLGDESSQ